MSDHASYVPTAYVLESYEPIPECGCWIWTGVWEQTGYGRVAARVHADGIRRSSPTAHRVFYAHHVGPIPDGMLVMHKCDTPVCVNPDHLTLGTNADNAADKVAKGRARAGRGVVALPPEMEELILSGTLSRRQLWDRHRIGVDLIKRVRRSRKATRKPRAIAGAAGESQ